VILRALPSLRSVQDEAVLFEVGCGKGLVLASGLNHEKARGRPENDWLLAQMLTHAATSAPPRATWPRAALPVADDAEAGEALSGFEKLTRNEGEEGVWYSYREDNVKMPVCRQTQAGHLVEWKTAAAPAEGTNDFLTFVFAGGLGYQSEPKTDGFVFLVNGVEQVRFDLPEQTNRWQSADGRVTLRFAALRKPPQDQLGLFTATLARGLWAPGQPCRFAVRSLGQGSRRWFGLNLYTDANAEE